MAEEQVSEEQEVPRLSKNAKRLGLSFVFLCIIASMSLFVAVAISLRDCSDCKQRSPMLVPMMAILATLLLFLGISILTAVVKGAGLSRNQSQSSILSRDPR